MKITELCSRCGSIAFLGAISASLLAQAPAPTPAGGAAPGAAAAPAGRGGGGGGGRGGAAAPATIPGATTNQLTVLGAIDTSLAPLIQAATDARNALIAATFAEPKNDANLRTRVSNLSVAEQSLAVARADAFVKIQASADKLSAEQIQAFVGIASRGGRVGAPAAGGGGGRGGRGGGGGETPDDSTDFTAIFDGTTLNGWDGDRSIWRVQDSEIIGESTAVKPLTQNVSLIWRGGTVKDFELKAEVKISEGGNNGIQYRNSTAAAFGPSVLIGYQADIDFANGNTGQVYEERARGFLARVGRFVRVGIGGNANKVIGSLGEAAEVRATFKTNDWNQIHIIARGNTITHFVNGRLISGIVDEDPEGRAAEGLLGLQVHAGAPMKVEFKNILLKKL